MSIFKKKPPSAQQLLGMGDDGDVSDILHLILLYDFLRVQCIARSKK